MSSGAIFSSFLVQNCGELSGTIYYIIKYLKNIYYSHICSIAVVFLSHVLNPLVLVSYKQTYLRIEKMNKCLMDHFLHEFFDFHQLLIK